VERILDALDDLGISRTTLLVIPKHETREGRALELTECPRVVEALLGRQRAGAELVQHGLTHRAPAPPPAGARSWLMHHCFARGEAEFAHLGRTEAARCLAEGRLLLGRVGIRPLGFVAPAWQQSPGAFQAVVEAGFGFTAFLGRVVPLRGPFESKAAPALTFCAPGPLVDHPKRLVMRGLERLGRRAPLVRLALHPEDVRAPGRLVHILSRLRVLVAERRVVTYAEYLDLGPEGCCATASASFGGSSRAGDRDRAGAMDRAGDRDRSAAMDRAEAGAEAGAGAGARTPEWVPA
jgi:predicted deacetylase